MEKSTIEQVVDSVADRWKRTYCTYNKWRDLINPLGSERIYELLLEATTKKEIYEIVGNESWTRHVCSECQKQCDELVVIGEESFECPQSALCIACIKEAVGLLESGPTKS